MYVDERALDGAMDREAPDTRFCLHSITAQTAEADGISAVRMRLGGHWALPDDAHTAHAEVPNIDLRTVDVLFTLDAAALTGEELSRLSSEGFQAQIDRDLRDTL